MIFSVGAGYFMFVINGESQYSQALANRTQGLQSKLVESLKITPASGASNHLVFTATNVGGTAANITDVFVLDPSGVTHTYGLGFGGSNTTPALPGGVTPQMTSASYDTGITIVPGTYTIKVITHRGNAYTATYPVPPTSFASSTGSLTVDLSSFRWVQLTGTSSITQENYVANCNASLCGAAFSSNVASGDTLVYALGWPNHAAPATPTDTRGDTFTLGASNSFSTTGTTPPSLVQKRYTSNCASSSCGLAYTSNVVSGNTLAFALGWGSQNPPSTPTDTLGNTYTLGVSSSVTASASPTLVQKAYTSNCNSSSCGLAFTSSVTAGDTLAFALGWYGQNPPSTPTDTRGDTFTLGVSNSVSAVGGTPPTLVQKAYTSNCNSASCGLAFTSNVASGNVLAFALGWYNQSPPSTPTDTSGSTFTLGVSNSVQSVGGGSLALDGSAFNIASATSVSASLTTTNANDVIYVMVTTDVGTINTPTATGLTFSLRKSVAAANGYPAISTYYAIASSTLSAKSITATASSNGWIIINAFGIAGAYTTAPFDTNAAVPASATGAAGTATATISTSNANDFVIGTVGDNDPTDACSSATAGSGFTVIGDSHSAVREGASEYKIVSATQTGLSVSLTTHCSGDSASKWTMIADAVRAGITYYSYIWYATAASSGADTITATFGASVTGSVSIYEIAGATTTSSSTSTGISSGGSTTPAVTSFTPSSNSFVIGNTETSSSTSSFTAGSGYTLGGTCSSVYGCSEYQATVSSATTVPFTLSTSATWVESAISFGRRPYYSYIWYTTAGSSGADTITATFGATVTGSVSVYEISGATTTGTSTSGGSSSGGSTAPFVTAFTPSWNSFVIGNAETASSTSSFTAGSGFALGGTCSSVYGCSEYQASVSSATTAPFTLGTSAPWVESAISFG